MAEPPVERLFFALWPDAGVRAALADVGRSLPPRDARPVPPARIHMTLAFLGNVEAPTRACLEEAAGAVTVPPFEMVISRLGWFRRSRVLWAGPDAAPPELGLLVKALSSVIGGCGLPVDGRPFAAHVTLARHVRHGRRGDLEQPVRWHVGELALVRSVTGPHGPDYTTVARWPLAGGQGGAKTPV